MKNLFLIIFCVIVVIFQVSAEGSFFAEKRIPDLTLALVITFVLTMGFEKSAGWIIFTGLLIDAGSSSIFGTAALVYIFIGWIISNLAAVADIRSRKILFAASLGIITAFAEIVKDLFFWGALNVRVYYLQKTPGVHMHFFNVDYMLKIFYTILASYLIYYIFRKLSRGLLQEPVRLAKRSRL